MTDGEAGDKDQSSGDVNAKPKSKGEILLPKETILTTDPDRETLEGSRIHVRALRSSGVWASWAENVVGILLGHGHLHGDGSR